MWWGEYQATGTKVPPSLVRILLTPFFLLLPCEQQVFCGKCTSYRLPLDRATLHVDFKSGYDARVCSGCYNEERSWSKVNINETNKSKKAAKKLAEELQALSGENRKLEEMIRGSHEEIEDKEEEILDYKGKVENLTEELETSFDEKEKLRIRIKELEEHLASTALFAQVQKRKIRSDTSVTPWKERMVVASPNGIKYYKVQQCTGNVDLNNLTFVTGCIQSKESSPVKGKSSSGLQIITKDGTIYEFSLPNGEQDVSLWQKHIDILMKRVKSRGEGSADYGEASGSEELESEERVDNPFKMGWLNKQPGKTGFWKRRWFVVTDGVFSYYKTKSIINPIQQLSLVNAEARQIKVAGKSLWCFQLFVPTSNRLFVMETSSREELVEWISTIRGAAKYAKSLNLGEGNLSSAAEAGDDGSITDEIENEFEEDDLEGDDSD